MALDSLHISDLSPDEQRRWLDAQYRNDSHTFQQLVQEAINRMHAARAASLPKIEYDPKGIDWEVLMPAITPRRLTRVADMYSERVLDAMWLGGISTQDLMESGKRPPPGYYHDRLIDFWIPPDVDLDRDAFRKGK